MGLAREVYHKMLSNEMVAAAIAEITRRSNTGANLITIRGRDPEADAITARARVSGTDERGRITNGQGAPTDAPTDIYDQASASASHRDAADLYGRPDGWVEAHAIATALSQMPTATTPPITFHWTPPPRTTVAGALTPTRYERVDELGNTADITIKRVPGVPWSQAATATPVADIQALRELGNGRVQMDNTVYQRYRVGCPDCKGWVVILLPLAEGDTLARHEDGTALDLLDEPYVTCPLCAKRYFHGVALRAKVVPCSQTVSGTS